MPWEFPVRLQEYGVGIFKTVSTKSALKKEFGYVNLAELNTKIEEGTSYDNICHPREILFLAMPIMAFRDLF